MPKAVLAAKVLAAASGGARGFVSVWNRPKSLKMLEAKGPPRNKLHTSVAEAPLRQGATTRCIGLYGAELRRCRKGMDPSPKCIGYFRVGPKLVFSRSVFQSGAWSPWLQGFSPFSLRGATRKQIVGAWKWVPREIDPSP